MVETSLSDGELPDAQAQHIDFASVVGSRFNGQPEVDIALRQGANDYRAQVNGVVRYASPGMPLFTHAPIVNSADIPVPQESEFPTSRPPTMSRDLWKKLQSNPSWWTAIEHHPSMWRGSRS